MTVACIVAGAFGAAGFGFGYLYFAPTESQMVAGVQPSAPPCVDAPTPVLGAPPPPPPPEQDPPQEEASPVEGADVTQGSKKKVSASGAGAGGSDVAGDPATRGGLLSDLSAIPGPVVGPSGGASSSAAGLDANAIQRTVQKYQNAVKRSCWQPALNNRSLGASSSARVTATLKIAPNGSVTSVSHSGDPVGYPGLANCIAARVKGWTFPRAAGSTTANIPFVFAAQ